jgi:hypothetical protein
MMIGEILVMLRSILDNPYGVRPSTVLDVSSSVIWITLRMLLKEAFNPSNDFYVTYEWLDKNKFALNSFVSVLDSNGAPVVPHKSFSICADTKNIFDEITVADTLIQSNTCPISVIHGSCITVNTD